MIRVALPMHLRTLAGTGRRFDPPVCCALLIIAQSSIAKGSMAIDRILMMSSSALAHGSRFLCFGAELLFRCAEGAVLLHLLVLARGIDESGTGFDSMAALRFDLAEVKPGFSQDCTAKARRRAPGGEIVVNSNHIAE